MSSLVDRAATPNGRPAETLLHLAHVPALLLGAGYLAAALAQALLASGQQVGGLDSVLGHMTETRQLYARQLRPKPNPVTQATTSTGRETDSSNRETRPAVRLLSTLADVPTVLTAWRRR